MVGFRSRNKNIIDSKYICPICNLILCDPVQIHCGHRFCGSCLDTKDRASIKCQQCHQVTLRSMIFTDRGIKNDMELLHIHCYLCHWRGFFKNYEEHLIKNHSNASNKQMLHFEMISKAKRITETFLACSNNIKILKNNLQSFINSIQLDKFSVEENNPSSEQIIEQNQHQINLYDGRLLWKIDNIKDQIKKGVTMISSPAFYTSQYGYKLCVRLYLNGNGMGQSSHLSIYIVLMRGEYDAIVQWPFDYQIIFCLCNFIDEDNHIIESFISDGKLHSFQKPEHVMNVGCGIQKFIPLSVIEQENNHYIYEGSMYIKVMVRKCPIPQFMLPYIMNIDLAWPVHLQDEIIEELIRRYNSQPFKLTLKLSPISQ